MNRLRPESIALRCWVMLILTMLIPRSSSAADGLPAKRLSVTVDFPDDITKGPYDAARLGELMTTIQDIGASRVNWMYYGGVDPNDIRRGNIWQSHWALHGPGTIASLGEPLKAAVKVAHERGLEIYGVLKPYNGGIAGSYPAGSPEAGSKSKLTKIGGTLQQVIPFLEAHPEMRIQRRPSPTPAAGHGPIREIRLVKANNGPTRLRPEHLRIWVSHDNFKYHPLPLVPTGTVSVEPARREVRDYHGNVLTRIGAPVRVVQITGLEVREPFVVLTTTFSEGSGDFSNTPLGMVEVYGESGTQLPAVVATHAALWVRPRDFRTYGLEFDMGYGHLPVSLDEPWTGSKADPWKPFSGKDEFEHETLFGNGPAGGFIGIALGKNDFLPAAPCEAYPEVRALWLGWIEAMLDAGVDGINLRISAHGCLTDEPEAYGWNPPVLAAYRQRFGNGPIELEKLATVRGDFYTDFLREAAALVHSRGKKLHAHFHAEAFRPDRVFGQQNGVPANIDFQWRRWLDEKLLDEVYLRTSWFEAAEDPLGAKGTQRSQLKRALADPVVVEMLTRSAAQQLPVTLNRYIGRAAGLEEYLDDLTLITQDDRFAGFDVYEFFDLAQSDPTAPGLIRQKGRVEGLKARWETLRARP